MSPETLEGKSLTKPADCRFYHQVTEEGTASEKCEYWKGMCVGDAAKGVENCPFYLISAEYSNFDDWMKRVKEKLG